MYRPFYGLRDIPFSLTPDPRYLYFTASPPRGHGESALRIQHGRGLIVATGEVARARRRRCSMLARLDRSVLTSYIFNQRADRVGVLSLPISTSFGITQYASSRIC